MYPGNYNVEWLKYKNGEPVDETPKVGSVAKAWQWRERGINPPNQPPNKTVLEYIAEDILVQKPLQITSCDLPGFPRSTFLMVFSPDGTKLASTHGNHNIYVSELASGKHVRILKGHPRTPWCIAFHPSHPQLIGSGCLGGQVRVWDIASGGSEVWTVYNETVIASIAFHPREQLLVIATYNELYFWDWSQPAPFTKVSTKNINEKVRYVAFDSLGFKLITGISLWACSSNSTPLATAQNPPNSGNNNPGSSPGNGGAGNAPGSSEASNARGDGPQEETPRPLESPVAAQEIVNSYQTLVQRYDSLVRNYQRLFMVRHRLINTPPLANPIDRGTDPMESYPAETGRQRRRLLRRPRLNDLDDYMNLGPGPSQPRDATTATNSTAAPTPSPGASTTQNTSPSRSGVSSVNRVPIPGLRHIGFASAFQPLGDERSTRLLLNPFSSNSNRQPNTSRTSGLFIPRVSSTDPMRLITIETRPAPSEPNPQNPGNTTSNPETTENIRPVSSIEDILREIGEIFERNPPMRLDLPRGAAPPQPAQQAQPPLPMGPPPVNPPPPPGPAPGVESSTSTIDPSSTNTQNSARHTYPQNITLTPEPSTLRNSDSQNTRNPDPLDPDGEAQTINESLDLIRDILRDSGTRLLNLITNMSMNILSNSERDESARVPVHVFTGNLRRDFMASSSDSETEHPEVNITRTPNTTFQEWDSELREMQNSISSMRGDNNQLQNPPEVQNSTHRDWDNELRQISISVPGTRADNPETRNSAGQQISDRMTFEIAPPSVQPSPRGGFSVSFNESDRMNFEIEHATVNRPSREGSINVSLSDDRFRVRTQGSGSIRNADLSQNNESSPSAATTHTQSATANANTHDTTVPSASMTEEPQPGPSSAPDGPRPSSRSNAQQIAFGRVKMGVLALQKHTIQLANMWLRGDRTTLRELRFMWEDLRRRILALPSFHNRSLLERCMMLSELTVMTDLPTSQQASRPQRRSVRRESSQNRSRSAEYRRGSTQKDLEALRRELRAELNNRNASFANIFSTITSRLNIPSTSGSSTGGSSNSNNTSASTSTNSIASSSNDPSTSYSSIPCTSTSNNSSTSNSNNATAGPSTSTENRRATRPVASRKRLARLQQAYRRRDDEARRRERNLPIFRVSHFRTRARSNLMRSVELNATRHVIRTRAMKILSVMFNMMMMCLEERGLSQLIINMLKTLKKALALTCFMMMSNRNIPRGNSNAPAEQSVESADVVRIQNVDHSEPINVDDNGEDSNTQRVNPPVTITDEPAPESTTTPPATTCNTQLEDIARQFLSKRQSWSHRLAVQIAAANRNTSCSAQTRRDMYQERRRQKALHRSNPTAHPYVRRRFPPVLTHRIPALRRVPTEIMLHSRVRPRSPPASAEPVAGPSSELPGNRDAEGQPNRSTRDFLRLAHMRIRTAARNRIRRYQTIRLYTPSSVREMFALQDFQGENREEPSADGDPAPPSRRAQFHAMLASEGLLQVNDPPATEPNASQRLPRIHEYLQPIILAQNALDAEDMGGGPPPAGIPTGRRLGGMAGLLDAGIISEALPAPSHRVQAWDFTSGAAPDIADSTKNVVVQRCRIHNDASIDISKDGRLLVALLPVPRLRNTNNWLGEYHVGVYSLEWPRLGQCLHTAVLEQSAVSVALSPTARYLAVGLGSRRFTSSHSRTNIIALLYKLDPSESTSRTGLSPMKELEQYWEHGFTSLNCLRWAPQPGQGLVYANNTGQLIIMS